MSDDQISDPLIISELGTDDDFVELVETFVSALPKRVDAMRHAVDDNDLDAIKRFAHQLKGAAGGYGFPTITDSARELEQVAESMASIDAIREQVDSLADMCQRARAK